jgi:hypothetical protein
MQPKKPQPVESLENLRTRVERLLHARAKQSGIPSGAVRRVEGIDYPTKSIGEFLNFLCDALPGGEVYLFGGVLRDLALLGGRGFNSDVDLVVEGDWVHCAKYLQSLGASRNRFGGFRLRVADWPVDIWNAEETWAIRQGLVEYKGVASLVRTTVLNWDAILMNWRSARFVCGPHYLEELRDRILDVVLQQNPNPLGMAVRVFRHLCLKDARKVTRGAAEYLASTTLTYSYQQLTGEEFRSYGTSVIQYPVYRLFQCLDKEQGLDIGERFGIATEVVRRELELETGSE